MYNRLSQAGGAITDTIMNRLTAKAYTITLEGDSMRSIDIAAAWHNSKHHYVIRSNQMIPCPISTRDHLFMAVPLHRFSESINCRTAGTISFGSMCPKFRRLQYLA